jgi:hypothetical protein
MADPHKCDGPSTPKNPSQPFTAPRGEQHPLLGHEVLPTLLSVDDASDLADQSESGKAQEDSVIVVSEEAQEDAEGDIELYPAPLMQLFPSSGSIPPSMALHDDSALHRSMRDFVRTIEPVVMVPRAEGRGRKG